jgi:hypothetical protein
MRLALNLVFRKFVAVNWAATASYCRGPGFISRPWRPTILPDILRSFPESFQVAANIVPQNRPRPLPSTSFPINYSLLVLPVGAISSPEYWNVLCPSVPISGKLAFKLGYQLQFKCDLERNTFWNLTPSKAKLRKYVEIVQHSTKKCVTQDVPILRRWYNLSHSVIK